MPGESLQIEPLELLERVLGRKTCLAGIGNPLRADDGVGPYLIGKLKEELAVGQAELIAVEDVPENYAFPIARLNVENVVFVDAVVAQGPPGTVLFGPLEEFEEVGEPASTHKLALRLTGRVIAESGKKVFLLGIVPASTEFGKGMTPAIKQVADELGRLIIGFLRRSGDG